MRWQISIQPMQTANAVVPGAREVWAAGAQKLLESEQAKRAAAPYKHAVKFAGECGKRPQSVHMAARRVHGGA